MSNLLRESGILTPEEWKVPKGHDAYVVKSYHNGEPRYRLFKVDSSSPHDLARSVYGDDPATGDFSFEKLERKQVHSMGREAARMAFMNQLVNQVATYNTHRLQERE